MVRLRINNIKTNYIIKLFYICTILAVIFLLYLSMVELESNQLKILEDIEKKFKKIEVSKKNKNLNETSSTFSNSDEISTVNITEEINVNRKDVSAKLKYILQWTPSSSVPFVYMGKGQQGFIERNCPYINCFVTDNRNYLNDDYTKFDVIMFNGPEVIHIHPPSLPQKRSPHQKYVFASIESSDYYPSCSDRWNGFYNWTWTFKLDSESKWGYFVVRDKSNNIIGPKKDMHWIKLEDMEPVPDELKKTLAKKSKAAAWFVSNCVSRSKRENFVTQLQLELSKNNLSVDIYGKCGPFKCSRDNETICDEKIRQNYHFYLSFENSFSEDYVTEKLLHALKYDAIPIVYGGANYTRFMPDGIYLNAREMGVEKLAAKMNELMQDFNKYTEYFRWKRHYRYHRRDETLETNDYCGFCTILNDDTKVKQESIYNNFREWWDPPGRC